MKRNPFSLIELVAVIAILSLMMMVAFPLALSEDDNSMETIVRRISTLFESARAKAMLEGKPAKVTINLRTMTFSGGTKKNENVSDASAFPSSSMSVGSRHRPQLRDLNNSRTSSDPDGRKNTLALRQLMMAEVPDVVLPENYRLELDYQNDYNFHPYAEEFIKKTDDETISFEFRADGIGTMPRLRISNEDEIRTIEVMPLTGRVHVEELR